MKVKPKWKTKRPHSKLGRGGRVKYLAHVLHLIGESLDLLAVACAQVLHLQLMLLLAGLQGALQLLQLWLPLVPQVLHGGSRVQGVLQLRLQGFQFLGDGTARVSLCHFNNPVSAILTLVSALLRITNMKRCHPHLEKRNYHATKRARFACGFFLVFFFCQTEISLVFEQVMLRNVPSALSTYISAKTNCCWGLPGRPACI